MDGLQSADQRTGRHMDDQPTAVYNLTDNSYREEIVILLYLYRHHIHGILAMLLYSLRLHRQEYIYIIYYNSLFYALSLADSNYRQQKQIVIIKIIMCIDVSN